MSDLVPCTDLWAKSRRPGEYQSVDGQTKKTVNLMGDRLRMAEFWHQILADLGVSDLAPCLDRFLGEIEGLWSVRLNDRFRSKGRRASKAGHTASSSLHSHRRGHATPFFHHLKITFNFYRSPKKRPKTDEKRRFGGTLPWTPSQRSLPACRALPIIFGKRHPCT